MGKVTIDDLAETVAHGFEEMGKQMEDGFREVIRRLDRIEKFILENHEARIRRIEDALAIPSLKK